MTLADLQNALEANPNRFLRFVLPDGDSIPAHAHLTEVGHVVRNLIDCGGLTGREEKVLLQMHVVATAVIDSERIGSQKFCNWRSA